MRVKHLWNYVPLPQSLRLVWDRLTLSRLTTIYFVVALVHCFIQVILLISGLYTSQDAVHVLTQITALDPNSPTGYAIFVQNGSLSACTGVPESTNSTSCHVVWSGRVAPDAFGGYPQNPQNETDDSTTTVATTSSSIVLTSSLASSSTVAQTSTIFATVSASIAPDTAVQSRATPSSPTTSTRVSSLAPVLASTLSTPTVTSPSVSVSSSASTTTLPTVPVVAAIRAALGKRMYIPARIPGAKTHSFAKRDINITPVFSQPNGTFQGVRLRGLSAANYDGPNQPTSDAFVSNVCVHTLQWPLQRLWDAQREDAAFIGFQLWVLGMSVVALLNESVPHIIAALLTHLLATGWSAFKLVHTTNFHSEFNSLTTHGACGGVNLLPTYWRSRANAEIPVLVLNVVVLVGSSYMSWRLLKTFGWLTFKRVGASLEINRIYRSVLCLAIVLQLSLYFMVLSMALWFVELYSGPGVRSTPMNRFYKTVVAVELLALVPWLIMGWYAVRREMHRVMLAFLTLSALFVLAWAAMFVCPIWRLTFLTWMFFRVVSLSAAILTVLALALGITCFFSFGKGLPKYLSRIQDPEVGNFEPAQLPPYDSEKEEKVEFPSQNAYPTFSVAFPARPGSISSGHSHTRSGSSHSRSESTYSYSKPVHTSSELTHTRTGSTYTRAGSISIHMRTESTHTITGSTHTRSGSTHTHSGSIHTRSGSTHSRTDSLATIAPRTITRFPSSRNFEAQSPISEATSDTSVRDPFEHDLARVMSSKTYSTVRSVRSNRSVDTTPGPGTVGMGKRWIIE